MSLFKESRKFFLLAGPCVIEGEDMALRIAEKCVSITSRLDIPYAFKGSFKKGDPVCVLAETGLIDMVVMPVEIDPIIITSMKSLSTILQEAGMDTLLFFNRVHGKEKPGLYDALKEWFTGRGCKIRHLGAQLFPQLQNDPLGNLFPDARG